MERGEREGTGRKSGNEKWTWGCHWDLSKEDEKEGAREGRREGGGRKRERGKDEERGIGGVREGKMGTGAGGRK